MPTSSITGSSPVDRTAATQDDPEKAKLKKACREMEGYFVGMLLKQMHKTSMKGGLFEEKSESVTYREMFDDAVAAEIGKRGSFGIADTLYRELSRKLDAEKASVEITLTELAESPKPEDATAPTGRKP